MLTGEKNPDIDLEFRIKTTQNIYAQPAVGVKNVLWEEYNQFSYQGHIMERVGQIQTPLIPIVGTLCF